MFIADTHLDLSTNARVPVIKSALSAKNDAAIFQGSTHSSLSEILETSDLVNNIAYCELTTSDVDQIGMKVVRVIAPDMSPLTSHHDFPFLGHPDFDRFPSLFTSLPHPFP